MQFKRKNHRKGQINGINVQMTKGIGDTKGSNFE